MHSIRSHNEMRILVVEDELDLLTGIAKALREEGYAVDTSEEGEEGLYKATSWDYEDRKSTRLNSSHPQQSRMPSSA